MMRARETIALQTAGGFVRVSRDADYDLVSDFPRKIHQTSDESEILNRLLDDFDVEIREGVAYMRLRQRALRDFADALLTLAADAGHLSLEDADLARRLIRYPHSGYSPEHAPLLRRVIVWDDRQLPPDTRALRQALAASQRKTLPGDALRAIGRWLCDGRI